jgi:hypothetical protein
MSLLFINEDYSGDNFPSSNVGVWTQSRIEVLHFVEYKAETIQTNVVVHTNAGVKWLELLDGSNWSDHGFANSKSINILIVSSGGTSTTPATIDYLDGELMFLTTGLVFQDGFQYPIIDSSTGDVLISLELIQTDAPEKIEFDFNLTNPNAPSLNSLIDGEINRFSYNNLDALSIGGSAPMNQINFKSGGLIKDVNVIYSSIVGSQRIYYVDFNFFNWVYLQNGNNNPSWFDGIDTVGAINRVRMFAQANNPNTVMEAVSNNNIGNCGGFNENFNTGNETYSLDNVIYKNANGDVVSGIDYCNLTSFEAVINAPAGELDTVQSRFNIGMSWIPSDEDDYQNKLQNFGHNTALVTPNNTFSNNATPDPTVYNGYQNSFFDVSWSFKNLTFFITSPTQITVSGEVFPTVNNSYFGTLGQGEAKHTLWVSSYRNDIVDNKRLSTSVKLYDTDVVCTPPKGISLDLDTKIYDHVFNEIVDTTTTEDDVFIRTELTLRKNVVYESLKVGFEMYNTVTEEYFDLEQFVFNFDSIPFINGIYEVNENITRPYNVPPISNRNKILFRRYTLNDSAIAYGLIIDYTWLNDWRYWLAKSNADNDFFNASESNNGLNKDWQHYTDNPDWVFRYKLLLQKDGIANFNNTEIVIRPYEDEDVTTVTTFVDTSDGSTPTTLISDTIMEVTSVLTWNTGVYDALTSWSASTIEDFEGANRWLLSSFWQQGNVGDNPLKSLIVADTLDVQIYNNIATFKYLIDTNDLNAQNVSLTQRIYSEDKGFGNMWIDLRTGGNAFTFGELATDDIKHGKATDVIRTNDGLVITSANEDVWAAWIKFNYLEFLRHEGKTVQYILKTQDNDASESMTGVGSTASDEIIIDQVGQQEISLNLNATDTFLSIVGNNGTVGVPVSQSFDNTANPSGFYKIKITSSGTFGSVLSVYGLVDGLETSWDDETNLIHSETSALTPDETNLIPMAIVNGDALILTAIKVF